MTISIYQVAEKNLKVAETAIEQAEENLRMNEERYKYQVATQTDVLDAVVLLAQAQSQLLRCIERFQCRQGTIGTSRWGGCILKKISKLKPLPLGVETWTGRCRSDVNSHFSTDFWRQKEKEWEKGNDTENLYLGPCCSSYP